MTGKINATATLMALLTVALVVLKVDDATKLEILEAAGIIFPAVIVLWRSLFTGEGKGLLDRLGLRK